MASAEPRQHEPLCDVVEHAFEILGRKWTGLIIRELSDGPRHFCDVERGIPAVSARMLTERMKELESAGVVVRRVDTGTPVRTTYELTEKGRGLVPVMKGIERWARAWEDRPLGTSSSPVSSRRPRQGPAGDPR